MMDMNLLIHKIVSFNWTEKSRKELNSFFENRLIIIDEIHNIRVNDDSESKKIVVICSIYENY